MNARDALQKLVDAFGLDDLSGFTPEQAKAVHDARNVLAVPGETRACICKASPEERQKYAERMGFTLVVMGTNMVLDHRCPHHGEKAQPALWGRHKEMELLVTPQQWLSLGVTR